MKNLTAKILPNVPIKILPFENSSFKKSETFIKEPQTFMYVASLIPYKNHQILLYAWLNLKNEGKTPKLFLTIDQNNSLKKWIKFFIIKNSLNVVLLENLDRTELLNIYKKCEYLIYPSTFEAYGLPLIEASNYGLKILAADLDYCWDLITPYDFFNPYDSTSVSRCVLRNITSKTFINPIYSPKDFISKLL
jgi:glycosyltransferase involved in cell wall biosynthesis